MTAEDIYFKCLCGKSLAVDVKGVGMTISCPDCGQELKVPEPAIKLQCACGSTIFAPESMVGENVQCLSCKTFWKVPGNQEDASRDHELPEEGYTQIKSKFGANIFTKILVVLVIIAAISVFFSLNSHKKSTSSASLIGGSSEKASSAVTNKSIGSVTNGQEVSPQNIKPVVSPELLGRSDELTISSMENNFANRGEFKGSYTITAGAIEVLIDDADIFTEGGDIDSFYICLGKAPATAGNSWEKVGGSEPWKCNLVTKPGEIFSLKNLKFTIPLIGSIDLKQHWLVVEILSISQDGRKGYCYAMSRQDIFSQLSEPETVETTAPVDAPAVQSMRIPLKATNPWPRDNATNQKINVILGWLNGSFATDFEVWLGPSSNMTSHGSTFIRNAAGYYVYTNIVPLAFNTKYQWRIDSSNSAGITTGDAWVFYTMTAPSTVTTRQEVGPQIQSKDNLQNIKPIIPSAAVQPQTNLPPLKQKNAKPERLSQSPYMKGVTLVDYAIQVTIDTDKCLNNNSSSEGGSWSFSSSSGSVKYIPRISITAKNNPLPKSCLLVIEYFSQEPSSKSKSRKECVEHISLPDIDKGKSLTVDANGIKFFKWEHKSKSLYGHNYKRSGGLELYGVIVSVFKDDKILIQMCSPQTLSKEFADIIPAPQVYEDSRSRQYYGW